MKHHRVPLLLALASVVLVLCNPREFLADDSFLVFQRTDPDRVASIVEFFDSDYWSGVTPSDLYRPFGLLFVYAERLLFGSWIPAYRLVSCCSTLPRAC